jgi:hypothetical protein
LFTIVVFRHYELSSLAIPVVTFALINLPQLIILRLVGASWIASSWSIALAGLFISIPWWAYGVAAEFAVRRYLQQKIEIEKSYPFAFARKSL